jgi:hypothetical protein
VGFVFGIVVIIALLLALPLAHTGLSAKISQQVWASRAIPATQLKEPIRQYSLDQAFRLATQAYNSDPNIISPEVRAMYEDKPCVVAFDDNSNVIRVGVFMPKPHKPGEHSTNHDATLHLSYIVDGNTMKVIRINDDYNSLVSITQAVFIYEFFGIHGLNLSNISAVVLLLMLISGIVMFIRDAGAQGKYNRLSTAHRYMGVSVSIFIAIISVTSLMFNFPALFSAKTPSLPIPNVVLNESVHSGSMDQAVRLVTLVMGAKPHIIFTLPNNNLSLSNFTNDNTGKSVIINTNTMTITRIEDWSNSPRMLTYILHDGRYLGGRDIFTINDVAAMAMIFMVISGWAIYVQKLRDKKLTNSNISNKVG